MKFKLKIVEEWKRELKQAISNPVQLLEELNLDPKQFIKDLEAVKLFKFKTTKHYVSLIEKGNPNDPLLLQVLPSLKEYKKHQEFTSDPLEEHAKSNSGILQKYKNRVLLFLNTNCAINCRYCFRRSFPYQDNKINHQQMHVIASNIAANKDIDEVILSGGDPLMSDDKKIESLLTILESNTRLKTIRIHTRIPVVIPKRMTSKLLSILTKKRFNVVIVTHINHHQEISDELIEKVKEFTAKGVIFLNQSVLLKGINDNFTTQIALSKKLFFNQINPYYLHLLDKIEGSCHFNVTKKEAISILTKMRQETSGYLIPKLVKEEASKKSKTILSY